MGERKSFLVNCGELAAQIGWLTHRSMVGIWYLASEHDGNTAVAGGAAQLTGGGCRNGCSDVRQTGEHTVVVLQDPTEENGFLEIENRYELKEPYYIDLTHTVTPREGFEAGSPYMTNWCCYMNSPVDRGVHYIENGLWNYLFNPVHGQAAMLFPTGLEDRFPIAQPDPLVGFDGKRNFSLSDSGHTYDHPIYFGVVRGLLYMVMMDTHANSRFFISPTGGGKSIIPGGDNPAWDLMWTPGTLTVDEPRSVQVRVAYLKSNNYNIGDTAVAEFKKFREEFPIRDILGA